MFDWLTMTRLGEIADALGVHPAALFDAFHGSGNEFLRCNSERVAQRP